MGFEMPKELLNKKKAVPEENDIPESQITENVTAESSEKKTEQQIDYQKEFGLNDEQYRTLIELGKTEIKNWPPKLLDYFDKSGLEKIPKDGPEMAALVASQIKELGLEKEQSPAEKKVTAEIAKEQDEISPGILSDLIPKKFKKAIGVGLVSLSCFAASGAFSDAEAGGHGRPSFGTTIKQGLIGVVASSFDRAIQSGYAEDRLRYQIEQQVAQREIQMYYQERQMEMNMRMQERQMELQDRRMDRQSERQIDAQERLMKAQADQAARLKGINNPNNPSNPGTPSGAAF